MTSSTICRGNAAYTLMASVPLTPAVVGPNTSNEQTFTVQGLSLMDQVEVSKPSHQAGLSLGNMRVSAANTIAIQFVNSTAATITPTAGESYQVVVTRPESPNSLPSNVI